MAQTTRYVTTGIIRDRNAIDIENQKKEQALDAHRRNKLQMDQLAAQLGDVVFDDDEKMNYGQAAVSSAPSVVGETGPDETKRSPEELKNHPEDNPTQTVEAANAAAKRAKQRMEEEKSAEGESDPSSTVNELNKDIARHQDEERTGSKHKSHKKHDK